MDICRQNHWKYFIAFKEGSLPALWQEYQASCRCAHGTARPIRPPAASRQTFSWVQQLEHVDDQKRRHRVNALQCQEKEPGWDQAHFFAWLTNWSVTSDSVAALGNRGGRCRWKIENEGFNLQKNSGFNLEHAYSTGELQIKNFYVLMQIAHIILQLVERGNLLTRDAKRSSAPWPTWPDASLKASATS